MTDKPKRQKKDKAARNERNAGNDGRPANAEQPVGAERGANEEQPGNAEAQERPVRIKYPKEFFETFDPPEGARFLTLREVQVGVKPGYILRKVGQAYMVMPTGPRMKEYQGMITLNETGAFLFTESQKPESSREKLIEACKAEYGATDEEAMQAVRAFVNQCADCGLFEHITRTFDMQTGFEVTEDDEIEQ